MILTCNLITKFIRRGERLIKTSSRKCSRDLQAGVLSQDQRNRCRATYGISNVQLTWLGSATGSKPDFPVICLHLGSFNRNAS